MSSDFIELKRSPKDNSQKEVERLRDELNQLKKVCDIWKTTATRYQEKTVQLERNLEDAKIRIAELEGITGIQQNTIWQYEHAVKEAMCEVMGSVDMTDSIDVADEIQPSPYGLTHGIGISYRKDEGSKIYRVADPNGPLIPKQKFKGGELEISPGEGIHFGLHWG